jgi:hypothetical protein
MLRVVSAPPFGIRLRNVLPCTRVSPPESSRSANCVSFGFRGITSLVGLHGIFVRDSCDLALALLSEGSYQPDICRAEQERSLAKGKLVIPVLVQRDCDVPLPLQTRQYIDFSDPANYALALQSLRKAFRNATGWLHRRRVDRTTTIRRRYLSTSLSGPKF